MSTLIELLTHISRVMHQVQTAHGQDLFMEDFYEEEDDIKENTTIHNCGTAACVSGWAILDPEVKSIIKKIAPEVTGRTLWYALQSLVFSPSWD